MSGVRVGSRLEQLLRLKRQLEHEITQERARLASATPSHQNRPRLTHRTRAEPTLDRLDQLGVTTREVKEWAVEVGLLETVKRGRVKHSLVEAYAHAHNGEAAAP